jgi:hypothetical protein
MQNQPAIHPLTGKNRIRRRTAKFRPATLVPVEYQLPNMAICRGEYHHSSYQKFLFSAVSKFTTFFLTSVVSA